MSNPHTGIKPAFLDRPIIKQSNDFKQVQFDCRLAADPKPEITWLHKGQPLDISSSSSLETMLINLNSQDSSSNNSSSQLSSSSKLSSQSSSSLLTSANNNSTTYQASLVLKGVKPEQQGEYKCVASNKLGSNFATINLNFVQAKPNQSQDPSATNSISIPDGRAPRFPRKPQIKQLGQTLTIECVVEATPKPSITWYHDGISIMKEDSKHSHLTWHSRGPITSESELKSLGISQDELALSRRSSTASSNTNASSSQKPADIYVVSLEIRHPKASDGGTYRFNAVNELGESSANIALNFQQQEKEKLIVERKKSQKESEAESVERRQQLEASALKRLSKKKSSISENNEETKENDNQPDNLITKRKLSSSSSRKSSRTGLDNNTNNTNNQEHVPMEVDNNSNPISGSGGSTSRKTSNASATATQDDYQQLEGLPSPKRSSSQSSTKRTISVKKKKRPSLLAPEDSQTNDDSIATTNININQDSDNNNKFQPEQQQNLTQDQQPAPAKRIVKKRVSVKRDPLSGGLKDIAEEQNQNQVNNNKAEEVSSRKSSSSALIDEQQTKRRTSKDRAADQQATPEPLNQSRKSSTASSVSGPASRSSSISRQGGPSRSRVSSVSIEISEHGGAQALQFAKDKLRRTSTDKQAQQQPRLSVSEEAPQVQLIGSQPPGSLSGRRKESKPLIREPINEEQQQQRSAADRRGTYDGLRGGPVVQVTDDADEPESEAERLEKERYLASRGLAGAGARESLNPHLGSGGGGLLAAQLPQLRTPNSESPSPQGSRSGSAEPPARRGSILLMPDDQSDSRRPSIILAGDNKLRPGEIADRRRRSSIDIRRASAIEVEAADRPSTPLKACGTKPAIVDFQDNISGTENHTSYLTFGVEGNPVPTLRFFKGDSEIYEGGRYSIVTDGDTNTVHFCIRKSKPIDEARYKVVATNEHGEDAAYMQLFVSDESGMDFRAMLKHRQYAKWKKQQDDPNWGNLKSVEEERLAQIKEPKRPDNFIKPLQNVKVKQGKDLKVRFECVFSKSGVKAKWFRNNKEIFPNKKFHLNSTGDLHVLEIEAPYVEDGGKFTCQCLDSKCSAMLEVEEPDPIYKFTKVLAKGYGQHLNRELVLECTCNSFKAQVNWYKDDPNCVNEPLKPQGDKYSFELDKFGKKILRIKYCQFGDSGQYTCKIMNTPKLDEVTTTQVVISEKKFQIMKPLYSQRATEDDKVILECEVDEVDAPVKWYRKDRETGKWKELKPEQLKSKEIVVEGKKRRLIIKKAKCQDEGEYKCCTNADETACELFVEPSNKWRKKLVDVTVIEDEPLVLECELMERKPGIATIWSRNGKEVGAQGGAMQTTADERVQFKTQDDKLQLILERAKLSDSGDWSVMFNKMKCSCKVTVLPAEKQPQMRFPTTTINADVGKAQTLEIPYTVQGTRQSPVDAKILCNGQPVGKDKVEITVKDDKVIVKFKDPQRADCSDNYEFVLENAKGKQASKFKLDVQGPPQPPQGPLKVTDVFKDKCKLSWEKPLDDGGSPVAHYVVERQEVGSGRTTWTECGITSTCQLDVNDLSPKKEYKFRVRAVNKKGKSEPLAALKTVLAKDPYDPPSEPENVSVVNWDKDFVDLEWEAPLKDGGVPVENYIIEAKGKFATDWTPIKNVNASQGCKAHVTEQLKEGQQMQFRVRAANKMGPGEPSKPTKPIIIKPRFVRPYISGDGLKNIVVKKGRPVRYEINFGAEPPPEITWIANDQELRCITDKCEIEKGEKRTTLLVTNTTRADSGKYKLILKNSSGQIESVADVVVLDRPAAPEGPLVLEEIKCDQVTMKWRKPKDNGGENIEGYVIEKLNLETGRWVPAGECGPNEECFTVKNLMKGKKYKFRVRAKNKEGESEALESSGVLDVGEEPTIGKCPSKVTVKQGETAKVKIHFTGDPEQIRIVNTETGQTIGETGDFGSGTNQPKYTVFDDYLTITIPDADKSKDAGRYKVELKNKLGSVEANFDLDVTGPPGAPQGPLEAGDVTENSVSLSWRPPSDDGGDKVTHYVVERRDTSQGEDAWIEVSANCKDTNFTVTGLTKDQKYEFRVMAVNDNGQSKPLVSDMPVAAKLPYDPPSPPGKPEATPQSEDSVLLEWEKPASDGGSRITGYLIEKREVGSDTWQKVNNPNQPCLLNEFTVKNLIEDRKYEFRVIALNAAGASDPSECSAECLVKDPNAIDVPKFVKGLKKTVCVENGTFELECVVQGSPSPTVVWSKGNKDLRENSSKYCITQEAGPNGTTIHKLLVVNATPEEADEYSIKATNKAGSRTSRADVEIQTKPKIKVPPQYAVDGPIAFDRGESIQLKIPFSGNPEPKVQWFKGDEEIEPGAHFDIESDGRHTTLTIKDATREDSGDYRLVVKNALGEDSASFNVSVSDRPEPPRFPQIEDVEADAVQLSWKEPVWDGGSQITQYVIEKRELPMTSWIRAAATRFPNHQVVNLNEEKEYEFRIFAENIYGRSDPSEIIKCTTKPSAGKKRERTAWPLDANGKKIRSQNGNERVDDYDKFVKDGPAIHLAADIKTCPITDNYDILEKIGEGIFGEVYRVKEKSTGDYYAAKFTPTQTNEEKALIKKEIDTVNLLHHQNLLRLHDAYEDEDEMVTVHEFISGPEVFEKICEPGYQMTEEQVKKYMRDICEAVRHMHDRNVIHLDLKPENFVLQSKNPLNSSHEPKVKIVDFGLACKLDPHEICKISTSAADYAAPEILEKDSVGFYTDMWAIGVLAYVLMSGKPPFGSQSDTKAGQWSFDDPIFDKISPEGKDFIEKLLIRQKEKRMTAHECLEHPWLREDGDEETRKKRQQPLVDNNAFRRQRDAMKHRYLDWWDKSILSIGHISNYSPLRKLYADRYKIHEAMLDRRELAPRFVIKPQSTFAYESQSAQFYCMISSNSPITVSWSKENRELRQSVKYMKRNAHDNNYTFVINRCKMADFGEYVIRAENHHGGREEPVFLDVRKRPVDFKPIHLEPMKRRREPSPPKFEEEPDCPPKFNFLLRPRIIQSGLSVKLLCCIKGKPSPTITWLKDGKELSKRDYTLKHADGVCTLEIAACDTSHSGKYTCLAENPLGEDKTTADVLIEGKKTFTPAPISGLLSTPNSTTYSSYTTASSYRSSWTSSGGYSGRHQRSASLSRSRSPGVSFAMPASPSASYHLSPLLKAADLTLPPRADYNSYLTSKLYSPNYSMNTNRYLRKSYKMGPVPSAINNTSSIASSSTMTTTSTTTNTTTHHYRTTSRLPPGSRIPVFAPGSHTAALRRTLSSFGRSNSSLQ